MRFQNSIFYGRDILIATNHKKEVAISPPLKEKFNSNIITPEGFNTDIFGTFSGEIERKDSPLDTARKKSYEAYRIFNVDLVIASEGSFGPHPTLFFIPADDEILLLTDYKHNLEIAVREVSTKTNFSGGDVKTFDEAKKLAHHMGFPEHKVILRKAKEDNTHIKKDVSDWQELSLMINMFLSEHGSLFIETDMRAMNNPTRMSVIARAAIKLSEQMISTCPECKIPGFGIGEVVSGLPCSLCNAPTKSTLKHIYTCKKCDYKKDVYYPNEKHFEEPMFCDWCNP